MLNSNGYTIKITGTGIVVIKNDMVIWCSLRCVGITDKGLKYCNITDKDAVLVYKNKIVKISKDNLQVITTPTTIVVIVSNNNDEYFKDGKCYKFKL